MLNYSKLCLIMLCTRSTFPSTQQARTSACFKKLQKSIYRHSNIVVVLVQVKVDNSITEGEEKRKIVASSCKGPGLSSESENTPLLC